MTAIITSEGIVNIIYEIRGMKVMIDKDLAALYGVETKVLNQAVKRNLSRFPDDFMFTLTDSEHEFLRSHSVTLEKGRGQHAKYSPKAFTEHGILMLSSVLNSARAVSVNIQIMRTFTRLRTMLLNHKDLQRKIEDIEKRYDSQFKVVFDALRQLFKEEQLPRKKIGF